jgi:hypothetical protein
MSQVKQNRHLSDPIVEEVRAVREAIDEEVGHDLRKLAERARKAGEEYRRARGPTEAQTPDVARPVSGEGR